MDSSPDRPAALSPSRLPSLAKVIAVIGVVGGGWNVLVGSVAFLAEPQPGGLLSSTEVQVFLRLLVPVCGLWVLASVGLLLRREWGGKGSIVVFWLLFGSGLAWTGLSCAKRLSGGTTATGAVTVMVVVAVTQIAVTGAVAFLATRYFLKSSVRDACRK